jgi:hypothetical protein
MPDICMRSSIDCSAWPAVPPYTAPAWGSGWRLSRMSSLIAEITATYTAPVVLWPASSSAGSVQIYPVKSSVPPSSATTTRAFRAGMAMPGAGSSVAVKVTGSLSRRTMRQGCSAGAFGPPETTHPE